MKQMSCLKIGGMCDDIVSGETAEDMAKNFAQHIVDKHTVLKMVMDKMSEEAKKQWFESFKPKFEAAPEQ